MAFLARSFGLGVCVALACTVRVGEVRGATQKQPPPEAERIGDDLYRIGKVQVDLKAQRLTCGGKVNMRRGLIEYLAVAPGGKRHESVLLLEVRPRHLQVGLILLGLEPGGGLRRQGDSQAPKGSPCRVEVSWTVGGKTAKHPGEDLVWDIDAKKPMQRAPWVFSGSLITEQGFLADEELSLIATYRDPAAIINNVLPTGADDTVYKANERILPALDTPVTLTVSP